MRYLFREVPEACDNTLWIAERAEVDDRVRRRRSCPTSRCPTGFADDADYLAHLTWEGATQRWGDATRRRRRRKRASSTSSTSSPTMGFSSLLPDRVGPDPPRPATRASGSGPGRGSAAGCAVAYCLRITDLDPIRYDLLFERFLNPSRISMPDIDMDFDSRYRDEMIRYAAERYGRDHVAQIITFGTIKARNAVRDAARVLGLPVRRRRPHRQGHAAAGDGPRHAAQVLLRAAPEVRRRLQGGGRAAGDVRHRPRRASKVVDVAKGLEGLKRSDGIHAAAVVITKEPLTDVPAGPAQARDRPGPGAGARRHAVRDARRRGRSAC